MRNCQEVLQVVYEFINNNMEVTEVTEIRQHLDLCRHCFSRMEFERLLIERMRQKTTHPCPEELKKRIRSLMEQF